MGGGEGEKEIISNCLVILRNVPGGNQSGPEEA